MRGKSARRGAGHDQRRPKQPGGNADPASLAGGTLTGSFTAALPGSAPPGLTLKFAGEQLDAAALNLPISFPFTLPNGTVTATADLTASGYTPDSWAATLSGKATLSAANGTISGFDLAGIAHTLTTHGHTHLRAAVTSGHSRFATLALSTVFANGNGTVTAARLTGPDGGATATGSIGMVDHDVALRLGLQPNLNPPLTSATRSSATGRRPSSSPAWRDPPAGRWKPAH